MPTNVSIEFQKAKSKYESASTLAERIAALQEMRRTAPHHKGAENLRAEISARMAKLRREAEKQREQAKKTAGGGSLNIRKEGAGQVVLVGMPNSGKSTLLKALTRADVEISEYAFTTKKPEVGMMGFEGAKVQLVEVPALIEGSSEGKANGTQLLSLIRNADAVVLVVRNIGEERTLLNELRKANILVNEKKPDIQIKPTKFKGITIAGRKNLAGMAEKELADFLKGMGIYNASVILNERATAEKIARVLEGKVAYKNAITVNLDDYKGKGENLEKLKTGIFGLLGRIIVYTKKPGHEVARDEPLVAKEGATVEDVANTLHKDFASGLRYARVWGSAKYPGQRVSRDYVLQNRDIIEIYG